MTKIEWQTRLNSSGAFLQPEFLSEPTARPARKRIWDLQSHYHCSVIGTCMSTAELRKLLAKLGMASADESDHDLHGRGVSLAARQDVAGKLLNKALDERHQSAIKRYVRARSEADVRALWREDVKSAEIPGGYWATLTHPAATLGLMREAFGYVHMLSHLVGAANRADIQRLLALEAENASLREKNERQQNHIRDIKVAHADIIANLQRKITPGTVSQVDAGLSTIIADLRRQVDSQSSRREAAQDRLAQAQAEAAKLRLATQTAQANAARLQAELDAVERSLAAPAQADASEFNAPPVALDGLTLLYVGGRPAQMPHIRQAAADRGAKLLHHDGGIEDNDLILASLVNRADIILFPVDCVSHGAAGTVKRTCRNAGKRYIPLRSTAVTSFIAALCA